MNIVSTEHLEKKYNKEKVLVDFNITIKKGEIYALIGKNGAGKTTFMKLITGFIMPTSGSIHIEHVRDDIFKDIGVLIELPGLLPNLSAYDNLKAKAICYGEVDEGYLLDLLEIVGLKNVNKKVKNYSLGMKQRLGLALALVGNPQILVLDEPINGLDPQGISEFRNIILRLNKEKDITIIMSSHILEELSKIATKYAFIDKGKLIEEISATELQKRCDRENISIEKFYFSLIGEQI